MCPALVPVAVYTDWDGMLDIAPGRALLEAAGWETRAVGSTDPERILAACRDATAICLGLAQISAAMMEAMPHLRIIATASAGTDMVDAEAATARAVWVANVGSASIDEVASHALAMALSLVRHLPLLDRDVRAGAWAGEATGPLRRVTRLKLGVVGVGRIGRRLAEMAGPIFDEVVGCDPNVAEGSWPAAVRRVSLDDLLGEADVVSLHVPLDSSTERLFDEHRLARMKRGSLLVNVSRGALVDVPALLAALDRGHLDGAALDVLPLEPPDPADPVLRHPRVLLSPHAAFYSVESAADYVRIQAENVLAWQRVGRPLSPVVEGEP